MPIIRYTCLVGSILLGMLFLLGDRDIPAGSPVPDRWTSVDSLRAMAHLGEPVQGQARDARFVRTERAPSELVSRDDLAEICRSRKTVDHECPGQYGPSENRQPIRRGKAAKTEEP